MDRPDREKLAIILYEQSHRGKTTLMGWMKWDELPSQNKNIWRRRADQLSALFDGIRKDERLPDFAGDKEAITQYDELAVLKATVNALSKKLDDRELDPIEAKREELERILKLLKVKGMKTVGAVRHKMVWECVELVEALKEKK